MANNTNWLNISSMSGSSGQTILTLSAQRNLVRDYKTATIRAYNPVYNISAETYVTIESYTPYINVTPEIVGVPGSGGTYQLSVDANCSYVIAYPDIVSTYSTTAATGSTTITFSVPQTYEETTLIGNIVFTDESGQVSKTVRIEQYGAGAEIVYWPGIITFPSSGGEQYFSVSANCPYTITNVGGADWFSVSPSSGYTGRTDFTVTAGENTGDTNISGYISIDGPGSSGGVIEVIQQKAETRLVVGYYVTSTTEPTVIMNTSGLSAVSLAEYPDGTQITPATAYTFPATGMQYVYYTLTGDTVPQSMFDSWGDYNALSGTVKTVFIPNGITGVGQYAFYGLSGLTSVTLPDTLEVLSSSCFYSCALTSITLPNSLSSIGTACFSGCTSLSSITIPSGVTSIGQRCFSGSSVSSITFTSLTPPTLGGTNSLTSSTLSEIIVPCVVVNDYLTAWPQYSQYISCQDDGHTLYFITDTSNVAGIGETRTITILNTNVNPNRIGLTLPSDFPQQGSYIVDGNVIYITYPRNPSYTTNRSWTIGVVAQTNDGVNLSGSYRITQLANLTYSIPYTADTSTVDATGETRTITIDTSNLVASSITIGIEGATGVTYTYENGIITIVFPENIGDGVGGPRNITVTITAETLDGKDAYAAINYIQDFEFTGEGRLFVVYEQSYNVPTKLSYSKFWSKVELEDGTDITSAITRPGYGQGYGGEWAQSGYGYNFGTDGYYGVYFTTYNVAKPNAISGNTAGLGAYAFTTCSKIKTVVIPNNFEVIEGEAFTSGRYGAISFGTGLRYFGSRTFRFSSIDSLIFNGTIAPIILPSQPDSIENMFYSISSGGVLTYPCGSDYSAYVSALVDYHSDSSYNHQWNSSCYSPEIQPTTSYTIQVYLLGDYSVVDVSGETRSFTVNGVTDDTTTYSYNVTGPSGTTYTSSGGTISVTIPQCQTTDENEIAIQVTATSYNGLFSGTGQAVLTQKEIIPPPPLSATPLTFVIESGGSIYWKTSSYNMTGREIQYRLNNGSWSSLTATDSNSASITVRAGDVLQLKGNNNRYAFNQNYYHLFSASTGVRFSIEGNIMSLIDGDNFQELVTLTTGYTFTGLFLGCSAITSANNLILPASALSDYCYDSMFSGCTRLTLAPELPATTLATGCYGDMFRGCSNLTTAPNLPATTLAQSCYSYMFFGCTNLSLIKCLATDISASNCTENWVSGVQSLGTFYKNQNMTGWTRGMSGVPDQWTLLDAS